MRHFTIKDIVTAKGRNRTMASFSLKILIVLELMVFISVQLLHINNYKGINYIPLENGSYTIMTKSQIRKSLQQYRRNAAVSAGLLSYHLYTNKNPNESQVLVPEQPKTIKESNFVKGDPIKILFHGWTCDKDDESVQMIKNAYLKKGDFNAILVDWSATAKTPYVIARNYVEQTAEFVATFIKVLTNETKTNYDDITLVGWSLSAQIVGFVGKYIGSRKLAAIVSLDPAKPGFDLDNPQERIDYTDAKYVEVIHTATLIVGVYEAMGTADFYINGGLVQPGCKKNLTKIEWCSHDFAPKIFTESINSPIGFYGRLCVDKGCVKLKKEKKVMGGEPLTVIKERKIYLLKTKDHPPFANGP